MVIIFYSEDEKLYICSTKNGVKVVDQNDPDIMDYIPNETIYYVQDAHKVTPKQFEKWIAGESNPIDNHEHAEEEFLPSTFAGRKYIRLKADGSLTLADIRTKRFPEGVTLNGKWDFIAVDAIGEEELEESNHFRLAFAKNKIEYVDEQYVQKHKHKRNKKRSPREDALERTLIPTGMKVEQALRNMDSRIDPNVNSGAIPINIDD